MGIGSMVNGEDPVEADSPGACRGNFADRAPPAAQPRMGPAAPACTPSCRLRASN